MNIKKIKRNYNVYVKSLNNAKLDPKAQKALDKLKEEFQKIKFNSKVFDTLVLIPAERKAQVGAFERELKKMLVKNVGLPNKEARSLIDENLINIRLLTKLSKDKKLKKKIEVIKKPKQKRNQELFGLEEKKRAKLIL